MQTWQVWGIIGWWGGRAGVGRGTVVGGSIPASPGETQGPFQVWNVHTQDPPAPLSCGPQFPAESVTEADNGSWQGSF